MKDYEPITHDLCPTCQALGYCRFNFQADQLARYTPDSKIVEVRQKNAKRTASLIARDRITARKNMCRHLNNIDPDFPGKEQL